MCRRRQPTLTPYHHYGRDSSLFLYRSCIMPRSGHWMKERKKSSPFEHQDSTSKTPNMLPTTSFTIRISLVLDCRHLTSCFVSLMGSATCRPPFSLPWRHEDFNFFREHQLRPSDQSRRFLPVPFLRLRVPVSFVFMDPPLTVYGHVGLLADHALYLPFPFVILVSIAF